ncbi:MAG: MnhB domain-containing protein [Solirubrobacterales bacterium]
MTRQIVFWFGAAMFAVTISAGLLRLPGAGRCQSAYADTINAVALPDRHTPQNVSAVNLDYRAVDTLGEEHIFLAAVTGVILLMRMQRSERQGPATDEADGRRPPVTDDLLRGLGAILFGGTLLVGVYIILHGHLTPGGGFQGGVLLASAFFYVYLSAEYERFQELGPTSIFDVVEAAGAGSFTLLGIVGVLAGAAFLQNVLPLGKPNSLLSSGTILMLNVVVGLEVFAGLVLTLNEFLRQTLEIREADK